MLYHICAFTAGLILDLFIGDPYCMPHPIRAIGNLIGFLDKKLLGKELPKARDAKEERRKGLILVILVLLATIIAVSAIVIGAYSIHVWLGVVAEAILTCYIMAARSLNVESRKVFLALRDKSLDDGRYAVSMIVGRDTECLDEKGVIKAAVETVAENTSDGVIAPLIYTFLGGPILGFAYKAINTMDSMVGYHNEKYENFGKIPARTDDAVNYIPARISGILMIAAAYILGKEYSGTNAYKIFKRDRYNHKSPNSAQTESACAGALGVQLAGNASYFGKIVEKPYIGDAVREIELKDIERATKLMYATEALAVIGCFLLFVTAFFIKRYI